MVSSTQCLQGSERGDEMVRRAAAPKGLITKAQAHRESCCILWDLFGPQEMDLSPEAETLV